MSPEQLHTRELTCIAVLVIMVIITIAYNVFTYIQENIFRHDAKTLTWDAFWQKHKPTTNNKQEEEYAAIELKVFWKHVQSESQFDNGYEDDNHLA